MPFPNPSPQAKPQLHPEHRILTRSRNCAAPPVDTKRLQAFFTDYAEHHPRDLPWRSPHVSPFHLLLAELLLIQTKADDVATIWPSLVNQYKDAAHLARARTSTLVRLLTPLGLQNQRAAALKTLAKAIVQEHHGEIPTTVQGLLSLPHVGLYAGTAVACFTYGERVPIVDANVIRVLGRIAGTQGGKELRRRPDIWALAWRILPKNNAPLHNYGILDFAAQVCRIRRPLCTACPLNATCAYGRQELSQKVG